MKLYYNLPVTYTHGSYKKEPNMFDHLSLEQKLELLTTAELKRVAKFAQETSRKLWAERYPPRVRNESDVAGLWRQALGDDDDNEIR